MLQLKNPVHPMILKQTTKTEQATECSPGPLGELFSVELKHTTDAHAHTHTEEEERGKREREGREGSGKGREWEVNNAL